MVSDGSHHDNGAGSEAMKGEPRPKPKFQAEIGSVLTFHNCLLRSMSCLKKQAHILSLQWGKEHRPGSVVATLRIFVLTWKAQVSDGGSAAGKMNRHQRARSRMHQLFQVKLQSRMLLPRWPPDSHHWGATENRIKLDRWVWRLLY